METGIKTKVDYKVLSINRCKVCNRPLKYNSELKGHKMCYVCFKISKGKSTPELIQKQKLNFKIYKNLSKNETK